MLAPCVWLCLGLRIWPLPLVGRFGIGADAFLMMTPKNHQAGGVVIVRPSCSAFSTSNDGQNNDSGNARDNDADGERKDDWTKGGRVDVEVRKTVSFSAGSFSEGNNPLGKASDCVRDAWMEYHWRKGGGLPIVIIEKQDSNTSGIVGTTNSDSSSKKRVIAPVMMEETVSSFPLLRAEKSSEDNSDSGRSDAASLELEYKVTSPGPFFGPDLVQDSHTGRVSFVSSYAPISNDSCSSSNDNDNEEEDDYVARAITTTLVWKVEFDTIRLLKLYQKVTEFTIGTATTTVQEAVSTPRLFTLRTRLQMPSDGDNDDNPAHTARREWLDFLFSTTGGGLPLPPTLPFGDVLPEGGGMARKKLFRFPPGLIETAMIEGPSTAQSAAIAEEIDGDGISTACYRLENPGWWTFPFLVHTHLGRARFRQAIPATTQEEETTKGMADLTWEVEIRPYPFAAPLVEKLTEMTVSTIARNLMVKLEDPGAVVAIRPPRGGNGHQKLGSVPRATWVGRVLEAHVSDTRSSWEQSVSLFKPWTWGNSGTGRRGEDNVEFEWSDGGME